MNETNQTPEAIQKLSLYTSVKNSFEDAYDCAYLEISPRQAQALLDLIDHVVKFRKTLSGLWLTNVFFAVTVGLGEALPEFRMLQIPFADDSDRVGPDVTMVALPPGFDPESVSAEAELRVECHEVEVDQHGVRFTALSKYGDSEFTTEDLPVALLKTIADGNDLGLPVAKLESPSE